MEYTNEEEHRPTCGIQERGIALLARATHRSPVPDICLELFKISSGDSVQVSGSTGCSMLLYHFLSRALLPSRWCGVDVGGCGAQALFIDTDQRFSVLQLAAIMEATLKKYILLATKQARSQLSTNSAQHSKQISSINEKNHESPLDKCILTSTIGNKIDNTEVNEDTKNSEFVKFQGLPKEERKLKIKTVISASLTNLVYMKCQFSVQFITTLLSIDQVLVAHPLATLIFIDSFPGFYWSDRMYFSDSGSGLNKYYNTVMSAFLAHLQKSGVALFYVKQDIVFQHKTVPKSTDDVPHSCLHCGQFSTSNFLRKQFSPTVQISISTPKLNKDNSGCRKRHHVHSVHVHTDEGTSCLQATIHQYGIKWQV